MDDEEKENETNNNPNQNAAEPAVVENAEAFHWPNPTKKGGRRPSWR